MMSTAQQSRTLEANGSATGKRSRKIHDVPPRIYVVDDDMRLRDALGDLFLSTGYEVAVFASPQDFLAGKRPEVPSCLVLDIRLRTQSGLDFQQRLLEAGERIPVVLTTAHGDIPMTVRGMKQGAVDFLPKPFREEEMLSAVATGIRLDRKRRAEDAAAADLRRRHASLSDRERQVMALVAAGLLNKQVAGRLKISEVTVKIHRGKAMRKMGARSLPDLVRMEEQLSSEEGTASPLRRDELHHPFV
ncbi:response regulator [Aurantimonas sp. 22II-16-19i]|uniref:response regulator transcription factor n=1 Tax=Aurantimonas sp. 22II-16-19i TaxID=1317114 RepID=UPI0024782E67|nr:response regulator [Aurantimonas sp. 22II-16-19i]